MKDLSFYEKETHLKFALLVQHWPTISPWRWQESKQISSGGEKPQPLGYPNMSKCQGSISFLLPEKTQLLFAIFGLFLPGNRVGSQLKGLESKFYKLLYICNKIFVPMFSSFAAIYHKGHFRKILTGFSSLAAFLGTKLVFLKKMSYIIWCRI